MTTKKEEEEEEEAEETTTNNKVGGTIDKWIREFICFFLGGLLPTQYCHPSRGTPTTSLTQRKLNNSPQNKLTSKQEEDRLGQLKSATSPNNKLKKGNEQDRQNAEAMSNLLDEIKKVSGFDAIIEDETTSK